MHSLAAASTQFTAASTPAPRRRSVVPPVGSARACVVAHPALAGNAAMASLAALRVQRDPDPPKGGKAPVVITFIMRKPKDQFTKDMTEYSRATVQGEVHEVDNIQEMCATAARLKKQGMTFGSVRVVAHGQTNIGGVGMTPPGQKYQFVKPDAVEALSNDPACDALRSAMAPGASVMFEGCFLGGVIEAGMAWSNLFGTQVRSTTGEMKIEKDAFRDKVKKVKDVEAKHLPKLEGWLLGIYPKLKSAGEAPDLKTRADQLVYMKELFDRSDGVIKSRVITIKSRVFRPGDMGEDRQWTTNSPTR